jgi:hypothetical protein
MGREKGKEIIRRCQGARREGGEVDRGGGDEVGGGREEKLRRGVEEEGKRDISWGRG